MKRNAAIWVEAPVVEYAIVVPSRASWIDCSGDDFSTYQKSSREPVELAPMMRIGAFFANAPITPVAPAESPMSTAPEITACRVSPPPAV
jgi:hypothetical protein